MESEHYEDIIRDHIAKMPPSLAQAIGSMNLPEKIQTIGRNSSLRLDQLGVVERELFIVLVGAEHPDTFRENVLREAHLTADEAAKVTADANALIITPIRNALIEMHEKEKLEREILYMMDKPSSEETPAAAVTSVISSTTPQPLAPTVPTPTSPTPSPRTLGSDIAQIKLSGNVHLPSDAVKMKEAPTVSMPSGNQKPPSPVQGGIYSRGSDPYREPIK
jgi:hypothetical protein